MNTVVVIGSGPAEPGMLGAHVDSYPVVRMWNHEWQPVERYGSRYDHGLITTMHDAHLASNRRPASSWFFYNVPNNEVLAEVNECPVVLLNHGRWFEKAMAQGARSASGQTLKFTRGFAAVAATIDYLRPQRIVAIGMDVLCNGITGCQYYDSVALPWYMDQYPWLWKKPGHGDVAGRLREGPHDYEAEAGLIRILAAEAGVELVWGLP